MKIPTTVAVLVALGGLAGCDSRQVSRNDASSRVSLYCSIDEVFARDVLRRFERKTGIDVSVVFDSEAGKTTGLVNRIMRERRGGRAHADVFWSSELFNTILLAREGALEPYDSPAAADIPAAYRDAGRHWTGLALRARVIAFDPARATSDSLPSRWEELAAPEFAKQTVIANPLFGTTRGHVAAMFALWGKQRARRLLTRLREGGALVADGNSAAVRAVLARRAMFACTDTDDVWSARRNGAKLDLRYLDMGGGGTLLIPCSVAIIKGAANPASARRLVDFLVSAEVEQMLAESESRNIPVRESLRRRLGLELPPSTKISFDAVADAMEEATAAVREILLR